MGATGLAGGCCVGCVCGGSHKRANRQPTRDHGKRLSKFTVVTATSGLRLSETMACIWSIVSDGSEVQLNGNC